MFFFNGHGSRVRTRESINTLNRVRFTASERNAYKGKTSSFISAGRGRVSIVQKNRTVRPREFCVRVCVGGGVWFIAQTRVLYANVRDNARHKRKIPTTFFEKRHYCIHNGGPVKRETEKKISLVPVAPGSARVRACFQIHNCMPSSPRLETETICDGEQNAFSGGPFRRPRVLYVCPSYVFLYNGSVRAFVRHIHIYT